MPKGKKCIKKFARFRKYYYLCTRKSEKGTKSKICEATINLLADK